MITNTKKPSLEELKQEARHILATVENYPEERYKLRENFYHKFGQPIANGEGLGNSELAFLRWEIDRGVLNPLDDPKQGGSAWWRAINGQFIYISTLASLIHESGESFSGLEEAVKLWLEYIKKRTGKSWYKAHNGSIVSGYLDHYKEIFEENIYERYFTNIVLYRVLFAQAMAEGVTFGKLGKLLADPRGPAVGIITDIITFYPRHYPLTEIEIKNILHKSHNIISYFEDLLDEIIILPDLDKLYSAAADWDKAPKLTDLVQSGIPAYPVKIPVSRWQRLFNFIHRLLFRLFY